MLPGAVVRAAMAVVPDGRLRDGAAAAPARRARLRAAHGRARPPRPPPPHPLRVRAVSLPRLRVKLDAAELTFTAADRRLSIAITESVRCDSTCLSSGSAVQTVPPTKVSVRVLFTNNVLNFAYMKVHRT